MKWMLDTDTCIATIKRSSGSALKKLRGKSIGQVGLSAISLGELSFGAAKSLRRDEAFEALSQFIFPLEVAAFDAAIASRYGDVRAALERRRTRIGPLDTLIAAHALELDLILVTHNIHELSRIEGLRFEDWVD